MYEEFKGSTFHREDYSYVVKNKFDSGNTVEMQFWVSETDSLNPNVYVEVALRSYTKRKHMDSPDFYYTVRGKDGLRPALWATNLLLKFPLFLLDHEHFQHKDNVVYQITWSDSRRRDIYHRWLSRYGFYIDGAGIFGKCLAKTFSRSMVTP